jgi:hypothetical protein
MLCLILPVHLAALQDEADSGVLVERQILNVSPPRGALVLHIVGLAHRVIDAARHPYSAAGRETCLGGEIVGPSPVACRS